MNIVAARNVFRLWACLDLAYVLGVAYWLLLVKSLRYYDFSIMLVLSMSWEGWKLLMLSIFLPILLNLSIIVSMYMLFTRHRWAVAVALVQVPFRLWLFAPSIAAVVWLGFAFGIKKTAALAIALLIVEMAKIISLYQAQKSLTGGWVAQQNNIQEQ